MSKSRLNDLLDIPADLLEDTSKLVSGTAKFGGSLIEGTVKTATRPIKTLTKSFSSLFDF